MLSLTAFDNCGDGTIQAIARRRSTTPARPRPRSSSTCPSADPSEPGRPRRERAGLQPAMFVRASPPATPSTLYVVAVRQRGQRQRRAAGLSRAARRSAETPNLVCVGTTDTPTTRSARATSASESSTCSRPGRRSSRRYAAASSTRQPYGGTSMAAAIVAGVAALVSRWTDGRAGAVRRALTTASAAIPSLAISSGGRVNAAAPLAALRQRQADRAERDAVRSRPRRRRTTSNAVPTLLGRPPAARTATATACSTQIDNCPTTPNAGQADADGDGDRRRLRPDAARRRRRRRRQGARSTTRCPTVLRRRAGRLPGDGRHRQADGRTPTGAAGAHRRPSPPASVVSVSVKVTPQEVPARAQRVPEGGEGDGQADARGDRVAALRAARQARPQDGLEAPTRRSR